MVFESGVVLEDWRSAMIVPLYKGKGETTDCSNYRGISLSVVGKIYAETEGLMISKRVSDEVGGV